MARSRASVSARRVKTATICFRYSALDRTSLMGFDSLDALVPAASITSFVKRLSPYQLLRFFGLQRGRPHSSKKNAGFPTDLLIHKDHGPHAYGRDVHLSSCGDMLVGNTRMGEGRRNQDGRENFSSDSERSPAVL